MNRAFITYMALLSTVFYVHAQDTLNLDRAISIGLRNNFDIQIEQLNEETAERNNTWGQAGMLPNISFNIDQNNNVVQRKPASPFAIPGRNISTALRGQLNAQFILFNGFAVHINKKRLNQLEQLSHGNVVLIIENTLQAIILTYHQAILDREQLRILKENIDFSKQRYDYVVLKKELGSATSFDALQEQNNYLTDSVNVLQQNIVYETSLRKLALLLNEDIEKTYYLEDTPQYHYIDYNFENLRTKMVRSNTNLRNQYINQEIRKYDTRLREAAQFPAVRFNIGLNGGEDLLNASFRTRTGNTVENFVGRVNRDPTLPVYNTSEETDQVRQTQRGNFYGAYGNIGLQFTLFNGKQLKRAVKEAQVQEKIADLNVIQMQRSLENELRTSHALYNLRAQLVSITQTKLEVANLNLNLANIRYRNGALSAIDLRIVQENTRNAAFENYQAIFEAISSQVTLIRLTGGLVDNFSIEK